MLGTNVQEQKANQECTSDSVILWNVQKWADVSQVSSWNIFMHLFKLAVLNKSLWNTPCFEHKFQGDNKHPISGLAASSTISEESASKNHQGASGPHLLCTPSIYSALYIQMLDSVVHIVNDYQNVCRVTVYLNCFLLLWSLKVKDKTELKTPYFL